MTVFLGRQHEENALPPWFGVHVGVFGFGIHRIHGSSILNRTYPDYAGAFNPKDLKICIGKAPKAAADLQRAQPQVVLHKGVKHTMFLEKVAPVAVQPTTLSCPRFVLVLQPFRAAHLPLRPSSWTSLSNQNNTQSLKDLAEFTSHHGHPTKDSVAKTSGMVYVSHFSTIYCIIDIVFKHNTAHGVHCFSSVFLHHWDRKKQRQFAKTLRSLC